MFQPSKVLSTDYTTFKLIKDSDVLNKIIIYKSVNHNSIEHFFSICCHGNYTITGIEIKSA